MSQVVVTMSSEEAALWAGLQRVARGAEDMDKGFKKAADTTKKLTAEQQALEKAAKKVFDETRTPQERHNRKMEELNALVKEGAIGQETFGRAVRKSREELGHAGAAAQKSFGASALSGLKSYAAGFVGVSAAIGVATAALRDHAAARDAAAKSTEQGAGGRARMAQLFVGDPKGAAAANKIIDELRKKGFDESAASGLGYELGSAGILPEWKTFAQLRHHDAPALAAGYGRMKGAFGQATPEAQAALSAALAAAAPVSGTGAADIMRSMGVVGGAAAQAGVSSQEAMAGVSLAAQSLGTERGATALNSLLTAMTRRGLTGKGASMQQMLAQVSAQGGTPEELLAFLGDSEAVRGFGALGDQAAYGARLGEIRRAEQQDMLGQMLRVEPIFSGVGAAGVKASAEQSRMLTEEQQFGSPALLSQAVREDLLRASREGGQNWFTTWTNQKGLALQEMVGGPEGVLGRFEPGRMRGDVRLEREWASLSPQTQQAVGAYHGQGGAPTPFTADQSAMFDRLGEAAADMKDAARTMRDNSPVLAHPDVDK